MSRLLILCEGTTEVEFVTYVLKPHLEVLSNNKTEVKAPNLRGYRTYAVIRKFLKNLLASASPVIVTTMIDLFKIARDFPERAEPATNPVDRVKRIERRFAQDIDNPNFIPYLQLHEFESLVLAEPSVLVEQHPNRRQAILDLETRLGREFASPELVNTTRPPSYWIKEVVPEFDKRVDGRIATERIGLLKLRGRCAHFGEWLSSLETAVSQPLGSL